MNLRKLLLTKNECYITGKTITIKGIVVHSTGANNPTLKRYVGPDDGALGANTNNNHWNQARPDGQQKCVHGFIGKLANGNIATYQTLPWNMRAWHGGGGTKGSVNDTHIGFEICEDGLSDSTYFNAVYKEAIELAAYLCKEYKLNPLADGVLIDHSEAYNRGIGSNHGDVKHWFPKHGKSMNTFRQDVANLINNTAPKEEEKVVTQEQFNIMMDKWIEQQNTKPVSDWAKNELETAKLKGITDGTKPQGLATREQVAAMVLRAMKN